MVPDKVGFIGLSLGSVVTMLLAAESTVIKASIKRRISWSCFFFSCVPRRAESWQCLSPDSTRWRARWRSSVLGCVVVLCSSLVVVFASVATTFTRVGRPWVESIKRLPGRYSVLFCILYFCSHINTLHKVSQFE